MAWTNITGIDYIDIFVSGYTHNVVGSAALSFFMFAFLIMLAFIVAKAPREAIFLVPAVALIGLANYYGVGWLEVIVFMIAGVYLFWVFSTLMNQKER